VKWFGDYEKLTSDPVGAVFRREKELARLERLASDLPVSELRKELEAWRAGEQERIRKDKEEFRFRFGTELAKGLAEAGLEAKGQLPSVRVGMFTLKADLSAGAVALFWGPEVEKLKTGVDPEPGGLVKTVATWTRDLKERAMDTRLLRKRLQTAYRRCCLLKGLEPGTRVGLLDVLGEVVLELQPDSFRADPVKKRFVEYPRVRFSYDLYRLKASGLTGGERRMRLHVSTFDATTRRKKSLWVPDNEEGEGTWYSYLSIEEGEG